MDKVLRAGVGVYISLNGGRSCDESVATKPPVEAPREVDDGVEHDELNEGPEGLTGHGSHDCRADSLVPGYTEISLDSYEEDQGEGTITTVEILEVSVVEYDKYGRVNELADENGDHGVVGLQSHSLESERFNQVDKDDLEDEVDTDDKEGNSHSD